MGSTKDNAYFAKKCDTKQLATQKDYYFYNNPKLEEGHIT